MKDGAWLAWWPKGGDTPVYRHWVEDEDDLWGPPTRTLCGLRMGDNGTLYIGQVSETVTSLECPICQVGKATVAQS